MKKLILLTVFVVLFIQVHSQKPQFKLGFVSVENFITNNYTIEQITEELKPTYELVRKYEDGSVKYRDDSKSWEATITVEYNTSTNQITEIKFTAPNSRVFEYMDQLKDELGFKFKETDRSGVAFGLSAYDIYENIQKKLGAKIVPAEELGMGKDMVLFRIYYLGLGK